jgi:hypothetical protein
MHARNRVIDGVFSHHLHLNLQVGVNKVRATTTVC